MVLSGSEDLQSVLEPLYTTLHCTLPYTYTGTSGSRCRSGRAMQVCLGEQYRPTQSWK